MTEVARLAGVSLSTVSRVVNSAGTVRTDLKERVENAILQCGYKPDAIAQSLRRNTTRTIGLIVDDISVAGYPEYIRSLQTLLHEHSYTLLLGNTGADLATEMEILSSFVQRRADGLIVTSGARENSGFYQAVAASGVPSVLVERDVPTSLDRVIIDHASGIREATRHLLSSGHRRIALITGRPELTSARTRTTGFFQAFREFGLEPASGITVNGAFSASFGFETMTSLLAAKDRPSAVIAGGNLMLPGVLRAIRQAGCSIPENISVVGVPDSSLAELFEPPIGVVRWSFNELGELAASLLLSRMSDTNIPPRQLVVSTEFLPRGSCGAVNGRD